MCTSTIRTIIGLPLLISLSWGCSDHGIKIHEDPPTAALLSPSDNTPFFEGQSVAFEVQLDDNDDGVDSLDVAWHSDATGSLRGDATLSDKGIQTFVTSELEEGLHTVTVTATDPDGNKDTDDVLISVRPNTAPRIGIEPLFSTGCTAYGVGDDAVIKASVDDNEEGPEALILSWTLNDIPDSDAPDRTDPSAEVTWVISELEQGDYTVTASVLDSMGEMEVASTTFSIVPLDGDGDGLTTGELGGEDCDDEDPEVGTPEPAYPDADGDGYGDDSTTILSCDPDELSEVGGDCNDLDASVNPGAVEICGDGLDNDCDGTSGPCKWTDDNLITSANHTSFGVGVSDYIASSLAGGDLDGDGYEDLIVGAANYDDGMTDVGGVFIVPGPLEETVGGIDDHAAGIIVGSEEDGLAGTAISTTDIDGDGRTDLIIGAPATSLPGVGGNVGRAYVFFDGMMGEASVDDADAIISAEVAGDRFGETISSGGDLDGDGMNDFLITSLEDSTYATDGGAVSVFLGGDGSWEGSFSINDRSSQIAANESNNQFGYAVEIVGDVNGDGRDDVLIGAPGAKEHGLFTGAAFLFLGHASNFATGSSRLQTAANATYTGTDAHNLAGTAVTGLGDADGDGYSEFAISAPKNSDYRPSSGAIYIMLDPERTGVHDLNDHADVVLQGALGSNRVGDSLVGNIDLDNDGASDLIIGAPQTDIVGSSHGKAFLLYGPVTDLEDGVLGEEDGMEDGAFMGENILDRAGEVSLGGHDWTGDGVADLAITAPGTSSLSGVSDAGGVFVFFGRGM